VFLTLAMSESIPKRHHFIAEMVLQRFTDEDGVLFFFDKRNRAKGVLATAPRNLFCQTHLYSIKQKDGALDVRLERSYAQLESLAQPIIEKIVSSVRVCHRPNLTAEEREIWDMFFYHQWKRVPDVRREILGRLDVKSTIEEAVAFFEANARPLTAREAGDLQDPQWLERLKQNASVDALKQSSQEVLAILRQKGLCFAVIQKPNKAFIIGSRPVVKLTLPGREHLADSTVEVWLPIASDVAVTPAPIPARSELVREIRDDSVIRYINRATFKQSTVIAGKSQRLIASLSK
jgi:hypothetical protein